MGLRVVGGGLVGAEIIGIHNAAAVLVQDAPQGLKFHLAFLGNPVLRLQFLLRDQADPQEAFLFRVIRLGHGDGIDTAADHQEVGIQLRHRSWLSGAQLQQPGKNGTEAGAAGHDAQSPIVQQPLSRAGQILQGGSIKYQDSLCIAGSSGSAAGNGYRALLGDDLRHPGMGHGFKGILAEYAFRHRHPGDIVDAIHGTAVHLRECRQEGQLTLPAGLQQCRQLRADVAPEGGIGFLEDMGNSQPHSLRHNVGYNHIGFCRR